jgi:hypothetical protein
MLQHEFSSAAGTRTLPELDASGNAIEVVGDYTDKHSFTGGPMSAAGTISPAEYNAHQDIYVLGARWLVRDTDTGEYVYGGELNDPEESGGVVLISSIGFGGLSERTVQRFLLRSDATDQWQSGDELGFSDGDEEINANVHGNSIIFKIGKQTEFKRNNQGNPSTWRTRMYFWAEDADIRRTEFEVEKHPKGDSAYNIELVRAAQPDATVNNVDSWDLGGNGTDTRNATISSGHKIVGLGVARSSTQKHAPGRRFKVKRLRVWGPITQNDSYTVKQAVTYLLNELGATSRTVEDTDQSAFPYDAVKESLGSLLDDFTSWEGWYWTIYPDGTGTGKFGLAQEIGTRTWLVTDEHSPVTLIPAARYNKVAYEYMKHELPRSGQVTADPNPFPGINRTYDLDAGEPSNKETMQKLAEKVVNFLATIRRTGNTTLHTVEDPAAPGVAVSATKVRPGDKLIFALYNNAEAIVSRMTFDPSGKIVEVELADGEEIVERILNKRRKRINVGAAPASETPGSVGKDRPAAPTGVTKEFKKVEEKSGRRRWHMVVKWLEVEFDVNGEGTTVKKYHIRTRPLDRDTHRPIPHEGGGWRTKVKIAEADDDSESEQLRAVLRNFEHPRKWKWETQVRAEDITGQMSAWSGKTAPRMPGSSEVRQAQNVQCEVKENTILVDWDGPVDPREEASSADRLDDQGEPALDPTVDYYKVKVQVREPKGTGWGDWTHWRPIEREAPLGSGQWIRSKRTRSTQKSFHVNNPGDRQFRGVVAVVDTERNTADWVFSGPAMGPSTGRGGSGGGGTEEKDGEDNAGYDHGHKIHHNGNKTPDNWPCGQGHAYHHSNHGAGSPIGFHGQGDPWHDHGDGHDQWGHKHHKDNSGNWQEHPTIHHHNHGHGADGGNPAAAPETVPGPWTTSPQKAVQQPMTGPPPAPGSGPVLSAYATGADVSWTYNGHQHNEHLREYEVELWEDTNANFNNRKLKASHRVNAGKGPESKSDHFGNVHVAANRYYRAQYRVWGKNGQASGWSPWSGIKKA